MVKKRMFRMVAIIILVAVIIGAVYLIIRELERGITSVDLPNAVIPASKMITYDGEKYFPKANITTVLVIGVDVEGPVADSGYYRNPGHADFLALAVFDNTEKSYKVLQLNRDTMAQIPVLGIDGRVAGEQTAQLAISHTYGNGLEKSCENTAAAVSGFLGGAEIDSYVWERIHNRMDGENINKRPLAIIGAGRAGIALMKELKVNEKQPYYPWGFFDDDSSKVGKVIEGVVVRDVIDNLPDVIKSSDVRDIVLAIPSLNVERRREIVDMCKTLQCRLKIMPEIIMFLETGDSKIVKSLRNVNTEDLLGRSSVVFKREELEYLHGKCVLVSGGAGSIGSELCRRVAEVGAGRIVIFDTDENRSYMLIKEISQMNPALDIVAEIGSMTDNIRVRDVFSRYKPEVVFHAAAHKHVPLMEQSPYEAVKNNIIGNYNIMTAATEFNAEKFVFISTDKAVNPTSIMGATKRFCEDMIRAWSGHGGNQTTFVSVRFGNVLGSNGSVIPIFKEQIAHGGPVTLTDKRIIRYFMTIPEAVGLVLKTGAMASASETFILDMGKPVKILELAENLIRLSGYEPYRDIQIEETGLRPGEKLWEELLVNDEQHIATRESKIFIERNHNDISWDQVSEQIAELEAAMRTVDNKRILGLMKKFIPSYTEAATLNVKAENYLSQTDPCADSAAEQNATCLDRVKPGAEKPVQTADANDAAEPVLKEHIKKKAVS